jgi:hypothetical protein
MEDWNSEFTMSEEHEISQIPTKKNQRQLQPQQQQQAATPCTHLFLFYDPFLTPFYFCITN